MNQNFVVNKSNPSGTSLCGYLRGVSYEQLITVFGAPTKGDGYKTDAEWDLGYEDGVVITIYNWKDGKSYCGDEGLEIDQITDWHVGGKPSHRAKIADRMEQLFPYSYRAAY